MEKYFHCQICGEDYRELKDKVDLPNGNYCCLDCFVLTPFQKCEHCNEIFFKEDSTLTTNKKSICPICSEYEFFICDICDKADIKKNRNKSEGKNYCDNCFDYHQ